MRPNIILIVTDQQRYDTIKALGHEYAHTPNIDRLVAEGCTFANCHVTAPSCVPSRASLFTGQYPHVTGVLHNGQRWSRTWVEDLRDSGYTCINVGKMHTVPYDADAGFSERYVVENKDRYLEGRWFTDDWDKALAANGFVKPQRELYRQRGDYEERLGCFDWDLPEELHSDNFVGKFAEWWLENRPKQERLFLQVGFPGPHPPYDPPARYTERYLERNDLPCPMPEASELDALPPALKEKRVHDTEVDHDSLVWSLDPTPEQIRRLWAHYMGNVTLIDERIGDLLAMLERTGYLDNAVVIFTSDHGDCLGDHGLVQKWAMYDVVTRVPLVMWSPNGLVEPGHTVEGLCQWFDIGPTILELAGIEPSKCMAAESLLAAARGDDWSPRSHVFCEQGGDVNLTGADYIVSVRSEHWRYVRFKDREDGQLFDLRDDPQELYNLWHSNEPAHQTARAELDAVLRDWLIDSNYKARNWNADAR